MKPILVLTALLLTSTVFAKPQKRAWPEIINGTPVEPGTFTEVVEIRTQVNLCSATIVGPRAIVTAASCAPDGSTVSFSFGGKPYSAKIFRSPLFRDRGHNLALGVVTTDIAGAKPVNIGGKHSVGTSLTLLGYGCTQPGGGASDHVLRRGDTVVTGEDNFDMVSRRPGGAAVCNDDVGGPAYVTGPTGGYVMLGIASSGNNQDMNLHLRLDRAESQEFLKTKAMAEGVKVCGITETCEGDPVIKKPSCTLTATPSKVKAKSGDAIKFMIFTQNATSATVFGEKVEIPGGSGTLDKTFDTPGSFTANGTASNGTQTEGCSVMYIVDPPGGGGGELPTCQLSIIPRQVKVGGEVLIEMSMKGTVAFASLNAEPVSPPLARVRIKTTTVGQFPITGFVRAPSGQGANCFSDYKVLDPNTPPPPLPDFAIVPAFCGDNTDVNSNIGSVCIAVIKKTALANDLKLSHVVQLTFKDGSREVLPILHRGLPPTPTTDGQTKELLALYANKTEIIDSYPVLDTRPATLTSTVSADGKTSVPTGIQGRSIKGDVYIVDELKGYTLGVH